MVRAIVVLFFLLIQGCSKWSYPNSADAALVTFTGNSKYFYVQAEGGRDCKLNPYGTQIATFFGPLANVDDPKAGITIPVPTDKEFVFTAHYIDSHWGKNRVCDLTVGFTPEKSKKYIANFIVDENVTKCQYSISEVNEQNKKIAEKSAFAPIDLCGGDRSLGPINGQAAELYNLGAKRQVLASSPHPLIINED